MMAEPPGGIVSAAPWISEAGEWQPSASSTVGSGEEGKAIDSTSTATDSLLCTKKRGAMVTT